MPVRVTESLGWWKEIRRKVLNKDSELRTDCLSAEAAMGAPIIVQEYRLLSVLVSGMAAGI